ncbi:hypothetical protein Aab01nite_36080 [Paractinoplanes abujensis]|nr:hypothetical protein Aab01nite_36080 [Actinoplanes abujensis]
MVEKDEPVRIRESGSDEAPHVLVAAIPVGEHHRLTGGIAGHGDGISLCRSHVPVTIRLRSVLHIALVVRHLHHEVGPPAAAAGGTPPLTWELTAPPGMPRQ